MERLGIVGLANSGKSALFNALTGMHVDVAAHPYTTTDTNVGVAHVPDERLDTLAKIAHSRKVVHASLNLIDIAGLASGASGGVGLGNKFLAQIREVDAILFVLRAFCDPNVIYEVDPPDPAADLEILETELCLADIESVESRLPKVHKTAQANVSHKPLLVALEAAREVLADGVALYRAGLDDSVTAALHDLFLLTNKTVLYVVNIGEGDLGRQAEIESSLREVAGPDADIAALCISLEAEVAELEDPRERSDLLASYGVTEAALGRVASAAYHALGKRTFLTTGEKESRAWTIRAGDSASAAAGVIHSDFERGFIRAEVVAYDELVTAGGWDEARKAGLARLEGKDYVVCDGDVVEFRFNV